MARKKLGLIDDWQKVHTFASFRVGAIGTLLSAIDLVFQIWGALPTELQEKIPYASTVSLVLFLLVMVSRVVKWKDEDADLQT